MDRHEKEVDAMTTTTDTINKPLLKLIGRDGNAFALLGLARNAARKAGWTAARWDAIQKAAMGGDYDHLLGVLMEHFDVY
jgi:hypothetical protein